MSKKNFIELGEALRYTRAELARVIPDATLAEQAFKVVLADLIRFCRRQNAAFKADRFTEFVYGQCGPNGGRAKV